MPIQRQQESEKVFMTHIPTMGTTAGWNVMALVSGIPVFLQLASSLKGCSKRYARFCHYYRHKSKGGSRCHWGSRMLKRLVEKGRGRQSTKNRVSPGQQKLPFAFDIRLNQIPEEWHQVAVRFRRANGIRDGDSRILLG